MLEYRHVAFTQGTIYCIVRILTVQSTAHIDTFDKWPPTTKLNNKTWF